MPPFTPKPKQERVDRIYVGVDPGQNGGIAWRYANKADATPIPDTEADMVERFREITTSASINQCEIVGLIEQVSSMPKQGVASMFKFGRNYGFLRGCMISLRIPFSEVLPQRWQKEFTAKHKKDFATDSQWKNHLKGIAQQLFPQLKITNKTADALLIAEYNRRLNENQLKSSK